VLIAGAAHRGRRKLLRPKRIEARRGQEQRGSRDLVAEAGAHRNSLAANGAAAAQHGCAALGLHTRTETMRLDAFPAIGLKCALRHRNALLFPEEILRLDGKP
jgi:hypothetical protein